MTQQLIIESLRKTYGNQAAVEMFDLSVEKGCFLSLLGPSGSGKTTVLNMIAGLTQPTAGRILIGGADVSNAPARQRNIGMVFQNYALFPHQTVFGNVAFPLEVRGEKQDDVVRMVRDVLAMVRLDHLADRFPSELSGGQQQRVALARAIVFKPALLLLDEPLGALDRRLRESLRQELRSLQRQTGITTIMVTHDQEEALSMSDRIVVMSAGRARQDATPEELYNRPHNRFVAEFMGSANVVVAEMSNAEGTMAKIGGVSFQLTAQCQGAEDSMAFAIRPESVVFQASSAELDSLPCSVENSEYCGDYYRLHLCVDGVGHMSSHLRTNSPPRAGATGRVSWAADDMHPLHPDENRGSHT
ncbi:ABC transporter ATP-binding protein [Agrobacterium tumefaciens]|uniref:ABC transporter ATP-binding protein n=1 Tax=Agrobacterium tumefaciens complex TaxID=1183400 RepID=UPI0015733C46|nr:ABC transporter ATP-binding protein [Agrobacterium fabrum]NSZ09737.1 ABC transporter ATP-binding protein [Agrobacterium tumefaciens]